MAMKRKVTAALLVVFGLVVGLLFNGVLSTPTPAPAAAAPAEKQTLSKAELDSLFAFAGNLEKLFHYAAEQVDPAVVKIQSTQMVREMVPENPFEEFFRGMPGVPPGFPQGGGQGGGREMQQPRRSLGSGMIVDKEGHILTNFHVIEGAQQLQVMLADGRTFDGEVVGTDEKTDLAVVRMKTNAADFPFVELGDSSKLEVGEWVLAAGSPFGLTQTVSAGIISATGRTGIGAGDYGSMLQTDAAINPGNSGGPLINLHGQVVGINTAIASPSGGNVGIGFAIPIDMAKDVLPDLIAGRKVVRGWLGIEIWDLTPELAESFGYKGAGGVLVNKVMPGTPAEKAGLKDGDIIVTFDGKPVTAPEELQRAVAATKPEARTAATIWREGKEMDIRITIGNQAAAEKEVSANWLGISVKDLPADAAAQMGIPDAKGVVVTKVDPSSPAADFLEPGFVIVAASQIKITSSEQFNKLVEAVRPGAGMLMRVFDPSQQHSMFRVAHRPAR
jgi:serine protease Do